MPPPSFATVATTASASAAGSHFRTPAEAGRQPAPVFLSMPVPFQQAIVNLRQQPGAADVGGGGAVGGGEVAPTSEGDVDWGLVFLGVGILAAGAGGVWWITKRQKRRRRRR